MMAKDNKTEFLSGNFINVARHDLLKNRNTMLLTAAAIVGCYMLIGTILGYTNSGGGNNELMIFWLMAEILMCMCASMAFSGMKNKEGRIGELMLPATPFEKCLVRWIMVVPLAFVVCVLGIYAGDATRMFVQWASDGPYAHGEHYMSVVDVWSVFEKSENSVRTAMGFSQWSGFLFTQSVFFFGAIFWPKHSFLKTFAALCVVQALFSGALILISRRFVVDITPDQLRTAFNSFGISAIVMAAAMYVLSWIQYRRTQIISRF